MSITNYAELQTAVANYLHRSDLTASIPDFISLAESKLNRALRIRAMENVTTGTCGASVSLPTGFLEMRSLTANNGATTWPLTYITPDKIGVDTSAPKEYSIIGDSIYFKGTSAAYGYTLTYYKKFDALSAGANWLITNAPDAYLYATLLEASPYINGDSRLGMWADMLKAVVDQLNTADRDDRYGSSLCVKVN